MSNSTEDSRETPAISELLKLLLSLEKGVDTVRATVHLSKDGRLATEAHIRHYNYELEHGMTFNLYSQEDQKESTVLEDIADENDTIPKKPAYQTFQDSEEVARIWHKWPDRWREEVESVDGLEISYDVSDGEGGQRWVYEPPDWASYTSDNYGSNRGYPSLSYLLEPSLLRPGLDETSLQIVGRSERAGRQTLEVEAKTFTWDHAPAGYPWVSGADDHIFSVDMEIGVILRFAARIDGNEFDVADVAEIVLDEEFPKGTFRLDLPGVEF